MNLIEFSYNSNTWSKCYKTFNGHNLRIKIRLFVPRKPFHDSIVFAGKACLPK